jgi:hypothetical protein
MNPADPAEPIGPETALRAKLRMAYLLLLLFVIHIVEAYITFPFVDHTSSAQNVAYGFIVAAPFYTINLLFILVTHRDLAALRMDAQATSDHS